MPIPALNSGDDEDDEGDEDDDGPGATEIQLGGLNTTDKRFRAYKGYTGCLSSTYNICFDENLYLWLDVKKKTVSSCRRSSFNKRRCRHEAARGVHAVH